MKATDAAGFLDQGKNILLSGLDGTARAFYITELVKAMNRALVYIVPEEEKAWDTAHILRGIMGNRAVHVLPPRDIISSVNQESAINLRRLSFLNAALENPKTPCIFVVSAASLLVETITRKVFQESRLMVAEGDNLDLEQFLRQLVEMGYVRCPAVEAAGQFAVRGGIVDVFPVQVAEPVRMELFGDQVDTLKSFSVETQRSHGRVRELAIPPALESMGSGGKVWEYFAPEWPLWVEDYAQVREAWNTQGKRYRNLLRHVDDVSYQIYPADELPRIIADRPAIYHSFFPRRPYNIPVGLQQHISQRDCEPFWAKPGRLPLVLKEWLEKGWRVILAMPEKRTQDSMREHLKEYGFADRVEMVKWKLEKGFVSPTLETAVISDRDLGAKRTAKAKTSGKPALSVSELTLGEHVVHENHGIGIFQGITGMEVDGVYREYLLIQYAGADRLYLPIDKIDLISRYSGGDAREPKLHKLGGNEWERTKKRVRESIQDLTSELLALYAAREKAVGFAFSKDSVWQKEFEEGFEYEETPDQVRAVEETKADMERNRPMDRLVCGDVGYGKTEVALRAAYKAIMDHKQVAVLVPTTILAEQHFQTFKRRMEPYPAVIEVLSRFRTAGQQKKVIDELRRGIIDIVIGTHRLLSRDVQFKDLGLLIIDEEHRFGVRQKERIKLIAESVDVLSLSATPIPRTLHMALTGLRDLSLIETPPPERYPINTYVMEYNPEIVREAILAELERGGQVFYVHNRINDMEKVLKGLKSLLPDHVTIDVVHGRMEEKEMARVMERFISGESQVLLCTTIIESGLDMPNVNTLIVDEADRMGLAQLYQLRGRIGRSNRVAYAYLTYRRDKLVTEAAQKRLNAIREFTELGSGMKIALRDLEIRGAGNILGPEQHGHIAAVGFDLYCRLLEEETARSRGVEVKAQEQPQIDIKVDTYIPDGYIEEPSLKVQIYRQAMMADSVKKIKEIEEDLIDRFGPLPEPTRNLLRVAQMRLIAKNKNIRYINTDKRKLEITLDVPLGEKVKELARLQDKYGFSISVNNQNTLVLRSPRGMSLNALEDLLEII